MEASISVEASNKRGGFKICCYGVFAALVEKKIQEDYGRAYLTPARDNIFFFVYVKKI